MLIIGLILIFLGGIAASDVTLHFALFLSTTAVSMAQDQLYLPVQGESLRLCGGRRYAEAKRIAREPKIPSHTELQVPHQQ